MDKSTIAQIIKEKVLFTGLNLESLDLTMDDLTDDRELFGPNGLGIDSVDALEIIMGIKRHLNHEIKGADAEFFQKYFVTIGGIVDYLIEALSNETVPAGE